MHQRRNQKARAVVAQAVDLSFAVPQVVAHRVMRMALAGAVPSSRDRKEFERMGAEKVAAFEESWNAMALQTMRAQQRLAFSLMQSFWMPWAGAFARNVSQQFDHGAMDLLAAGMAPLRRRAVANAKRLSTTSLK